jgi:transcriptional regulator with XRE-family HTH domain
MASSLWDKTNRGATNLLQTWARAERLSQVERAQLDAKLDILAKTAFDVVIHTCLIRGAIGGPHLYKLRTEAKMRTLILFLCCGPGEPPGYTLLQGAVEAGGHIHPHDAQEKARRLREELIIDPQRRCQHERFAQELTTSIQDPSYRTSYCEEFQNLYLATQISVVRRQRGLTQEQLAALAGTTQSRISRLESADQQGQDIASLQRVASELGLRLKVDFRSFGSLLEDLGQFSVEQLERPTVEEDPAFGGGLILGADILKQDTGPAGPGLIDRGTPERPTVTANGPELAFEKVPHRSIIAKPEDMSQRSLDPTVPPRKLSALGQPIIQLSNPPASSLTKYDVFLSHASEDKDTIARPLYRALTAAGISVWFDQAVLKLGDSLSGKIDEGLARCSHGLVIISPSFLRKKWPQRELAGLIAREVAGSATKILPIWHDIDHDTLVKFSPILADRLAGKSEEGVQELVRQVLDAIGALRSQ